jgi:photosystem II stability/assembly factor-like uncharacterized protein
VVLAALITAATAASWWGPPGVAGAPRRPAAPATKAVGQPAPAGSGTLDAVSCASTSVCWAVGLPPSGASTSGGARALVIGTDDGGRTWSTTKVAVAGTATLMDVDCSGPKTCMAVGSVAVGMADQGLVLATTDHGKRWTSVHAPAGATDLVAVSCTSPQVCMVVASQGAAYWAASTMDDGAVWQHLGPLPGGLAGVSSLACTAASSCLAAGNMPTTPGKGTAAVADTSDGGMTWTPATMPSGAGPLHDVACPTPSDCLAVGSRSPSTIGVAQGQGEVLSSTDGGGTWTTGAAPASVSDAFAISCSTTSRCTVVGTRWTTANPPGPTGAVAATTNGAGIWLSGSATYLPQGLAAVSCPAPTLCVAAGNDELAEITLPPVERTSGSGA